MRNLWIGDSKHFVQADDNLARDLRRNGSIILSVFAFIWAIGVPGLGSPAGQMVAIAVAAVVTMGTIVLALRARSSEEARAPQRLPSDWGRRYNLIGLTEGVAIAIAVVALISLEQPALIPAVVCLIVGLHFFPLSWIFDQRQYRWAAVSLCFVAVVGAIVLIVMDAEASRLVVGFGAAAVLWATSAHLSLAG